MPLPTRPDHAVLGHATASNTLVFAQLYSGDHNTLSQWYVVDPHTMAWRLPAHATPAEKKKQWLLKEQHTARASVPSSIDDNMPCLRLHASPDRDGEPSPIYDKAKDHP